MEAEGQQYFFDWYKWDRQTNRLRQCHSFCFIIINIIHYGPNSLFAFWLLVSSVCSVFCHPICSNKKNVAPCCRFHLGYMSPKCMSLLLDMSHNHGKKRLLFPWVVQSNECANVFNKDEEINSMKNFLFMQKITRCDQWNDRRLFSHMLSSRSRKSFVYVFFNMCCKENAHFSLSMNSNAKNLTMKTPFECSGIWKQFLLFFQNEKCRFDQLKSQLLCHNSAFLGCFFFRWAVHLFFRMSNIQIARHIARLCVRQSILKDLIASRSINQHICYAILIHFLVDRWQFTLKSISYRSKLLFLACLLPCRFA